MQKLPQEAINMSHELKKADHVDEAVICAESVPAELLQVRA